MIRSQSKAIADNQKQSKDMNPPISKAAAALNMAEVGTDEDEDADGSSNTEMMSVSHDQFVLSEKAKND